MMPTNILLLGESDVGKSHFGGQLLGRLNQELGAFKMVGSPPSLAAFESVLHALNKGRAAKHTSQEQYLESRWPIVDHTDRQIELVWPDYGGEQIRVIREQRRMSADWRKRVIESDAWILMLRIHHSETSDDIFSRPIAKLVDVPVASVDFAMSPQARFVEFLQWLIHVRGSGTLKPVTSPKLLILLSCWDELPASQAKALPSRVLAERMPLVAAFLKANWYQDALHIFGLSALERALSEDSVDQDYIDNGPEAFGYLITADGERSSDLTLALLPLV
jgi:Double-GTPase 1